MAQLNITNCGEPWNDMLSGVTTRVVLLLNINLHCATRNN